MIEEKLPTIPETLATFDKCTDECVRLRRNFVLPKRKRMAVFRRLPYGYVDAYGPLCLDPDDPETQICGIKKRLGAVVGTVGLSGAVRIMLCTNLGKFVKDVIERVPPLEKVMSCEEWLASTSYNEQRKDELRREYEKLERLGGPNAPISKYLGSVSPFIKRECYPEKKHARWINAPTDLFKCLSGPAFKSMEEVIYDVDLFGKGHSNFIKHVPVPERPGVISKLKVYNNFVGTDYTAFESHISDVVMTEIECAVYKHLLKKYPILAENICQTLMGQRTGRTRAGVSFKCTARRMSGDCCTSLGNGLTNLFLWAYLCQGKYDWDGYVEGDDGIFGVQGDLHPTAEDFKKIGFNIKMVTSPDPADLSFCGLVLVGKDVIREPRKFLQSFGWTGSFIYSKEEVMFSLLHAKALSALFETPNCPIVASIARKALDISCNYKPLFVSDGYHELVEPRSLPQTNISLQVRMKFAELYGLSPEVQVEVERRIASGEDLAFLATILPPPPDVFDYTRRYIECG